MTTRPPAPRNVNTHDTHRADYVAAGWKVADIERPTAQEQLDEAVRLPARAAVLTIVAQEKPMDIEKLLEQAAEFCDMAITTPAPYLLADRVAFAQIADTCANVARVMIEYERWQDERLEADRRQLLAARNNEPPF